MVSMTSWWIFLSWCSLHNPRLRARKAEGQLPVVPCVSLFWVVPTEKSNLNTRAVKGSHV